MKTKKKTFIKLAAMSALVLLCLSPLSAQSKSTKLAHQTEDKNALLSTLPVTCQQQDL